MRSTNTSNTLPSKSVLRQTYRTRRRELPVDVARVAAHRLMENFQQLDCIKAVRAVALYVPMDGEISPEFIFHGLAASHACGYVPQIIDGQMRFVELSAWPSARSVNPIARAVSPAPDDFDLVLVPGIVFDRRGYRVGFGGGFYDRFLAQTRAPKIGLAYAFQVTDTVPNDPWDVAVDAIVSEEGVYSCTIDRIARIDGKER